MKGQIASQDLHRMAYNAILFANKTRSCKGHVLWIAGGDELRVVTTNDYIILVDQAGQLDTFGSPFFGVMKPEFLKILERSLRGETGMVDLLELEFADEDGIQDVLLTADEIAFSNTEAPTGTSYFATNPRDLSKLSLVKTPPGEWPVDFDPVKGRDATELYFRIGPLCYGVISTLVREDIKDEYGDGMWF